MKNPLVRSRCGSVRRNSGRVGCAYCGHSPSSGDRFEPGGINDRLVLVGVHRAHRIDDRPAGPRAGGGRLEQLELELRQRPRAPAEVGAPGQDAEARTRSVDERSVEPALVELASVGRDDANVRADVLRHRLRAAGMNLDRGHAPGEHHRLAARRRAQVEDALSFLRADDECRELRGAAHRSHARDVDRLDDVGPGHIGRLRRRAPSARTSSPGGSFWARIRSSATSRPKSRVQTSAIQSG